MRCDHACAHCGSRAARPRPDELYGDELLAVADQLVAAGTREVTLIGGEAYLHPDAPAVIRHLKARGVRVTMRTSTPTRSVAWSPEATRAPTVGS